MFLRAFFLIVFSVSVCAADFDGFTKAVLEGEKARALNYLNELKKNQKNVDFYADIERSLELCVRCDDAVKVSIIDLLLQANRNGLYIYSGEKQSLYLREVFEKKVRRNSYDALLALSKIDTLESAQFIGSAGRDQKYAHVAAIALADMCVAQARDYLEELYELYRENGSLGMAIQRAIKRHNMCSHEGRVINPH